MEGISSIEVDSSTLKGNSFPLGHIRATTCEAGTFTGNFYQAWADLLLFLLPLTVFFDLLFGWTFRDVSLADIAQYHPMIHIFRCMRIWVLRRPHELVYTRFAKNMTTWLCKHGFSGVAKGFFAARACLQHSAGLRIFFFCKVDCHERLERVAMLRVRCGSWADWVQFLWFGVRCTIRMRRGRSQGGYPEGW